MQVEEIKTMLESGYNAITDNICKDYDIHHRNSFNFNAIEEWFRECKPLVDLLDREKMSVTLDKMSTEEVVNFQVVLVIQHEKLKLLYKAQMMQSDYKLFAKVAVSPAKHVLGALRASVTTTANYRNGL